MILVNTDYISGKELETITLVKGSAVQTINLGKNISQVFKALSGGELKAYEEMMERARASATEKMIEAAKKVGADGIVNIRYATSAIMDTASEIIAYGTAVKFK